MTQAEFSINLIEASTADGFSFLVRGETFHEPKPHSLGAGVYRAVLASAAFGLVGALSCTDADPQTKEQLESDLRRVKEHCDMVGIKFHQGYVFLRLGIDADGVTDEALVGRSALIHERAHAFRNYASTFMRSAFSDGKLATFVQVVMAFSSHQRARNFVEHYANKCKHRAFFKGVMTEAWIADLEDEDLTRFRHISEWIARDLDKVKAGFFRSRSSH